MGKEKSKRKLKTSKPEAELAKEPPLVSKAEKAKKAVTAESVQEPSSKEEIDAIFLKKKAAGNEIRKKAKEVRNVGGAEGSKNEVKGKGGSPVVTSLPTKKRKAEKPETTQAKPKKRTAEGYAIFKEEDLGWNKKEAGGTALCPFDCDCCF